MKTINFNFGTCQNYLFLVLLLCSCGPTDPQSFEELKRSVLSSFKEDDLKTKAADYLLRYLPTHHYIDGEIIKVYDDTIKKYANNKYLQLGALKLLKKKQSTLSKILKPDSSGISPSYLINHINLSVENYRKYKWDKEISFEDFCRYILPYRIDEEYPTDWIKYFHRLYFNDNDSSILTKNLDGRIISVLEWLHKRKKEFKISSLNLPDLSVRTSDALMVGTCHDLTKITICAMRAFGIPVTEDFTPAYSERNGKHEWSVILRNGKCFVANLSKGQLGMDIDTAEKRLTRVYRISFQPNDENHLAKRGHMDFMPDFFNHGHLTDVTKEYYKAFDIDIPVKSSPPIKVKYGYLAVFSYGDWVPIVWGELNNNNVRFENVVRSSVYLPVSLEKEAITTVNSPFILTPLGRIKYITADTLNLINVSLSRKYPLFIKIQSYIDRMIGGVFEGANDPDFKNSRVLYKISVDPGTNYNVVYPSSKNKYRYIRYVGPPNSGCNVAEISFYQTKQDTSKMTGKVIGTAGSYENNPTSFKEAAFDNNPLTFFDYKSRDGGWVGLDFGAPKSIGKLKFIARTDMNIIEEGHKYELVYWGSKGWKSLGIKVAEADVLKYNNVPNGALLWLKNLTAGTEERIFQYENGKQVWR